MSRETYRKLLPDVGDLDNETGNCPGYKVCVFENDAGVWIDMTHASEDRSYSVFLTPDEAGDLIKGIQEAIVKARAKEGKQKPRAKDF